MGESSLIQLNLSESEIASPSQTQFFSNEVVQSALTKPAAAKENKVSKSISRRDHSLIERKQHKKSQSETQRMSATITVQTSQESQNEENESTLSRYDDRREEHHDSFAPKGTSEKSSSVSVAIPPGIFYTQPSEPCESNALSLNIHDTVNISGKSNIKNAKVIDRHSSGRSMGGADEDEELIDLTEASRSCHASNSELEVIDLVFGEEEDDPPQSEIDKEYIEICRTRIRREDMRTLHEKKFLNDNIVNSFFCMLRSSDVVTASTYFFALMSKDFGHT